MFTGTEIRLDATFDAVQARLTKLARGGMLGRASGRAYDEWQAALARAGLHGTMLGVSRLARVRICHTVTHGDSALRAIRWEVCGRGGALVPVLDADIKLTPAREDATLLTVSAACRPSLAELGAELDPAAMRRLAQAAIQAFTTHIATAIMDPGAWPDARHSPTLPEPASPAATSRPCAQIPRFRDPRPGRPGAYVSSGSARAAREDRYQNCAGLAGEPAGATRGHE